jgi:hypothetical protein
MPGDGAPRFTFASAEVVDQVDANEDMRVQYAFRVIPGPPTESDRIFKGESNEMLLAFREGGTDESHSQMSFCTSPTAAGAIEMATIAVYAVLQRFPKEYHRRILNLIGTGLMRMDEEKGNDK